MRKRQESQRTKTFYAGQSLLDSLEEAASERGLTDSAFIRQVLKGFLANEDKNKVGVLNSNS